VIALGVRHAHMKNSRVLNSLYAELCCGVKKQLSAWPSSVFAKNVLVFNFQLLPEINLAKLGEKTLPPTSCNLLLSLCICPSPCFGYDTSGRQGKIYNITVVSYI